MKMRNILMASMYGLFIITSQSCFNDDDSVIHGRCDNCKPQQQTGKEKEKGKGSVSIIFDNYLGDQKMKISDNSIRYTSSNQQTIKEITAFDYIVSNFSLKNETGTSFVYPKDKSYFIISEEGKKKTGKKHINIHLDSIAGGEYTAINFILGVDVDSGDWGANPPEYAEAFENKARNYGLDWMWMMGKEPTHRIFKNLKFEGTFSDKDAANDSAFRLHVTDDSDNKDHPFTYRKITIQFPENQPLLVNEDSKGHIYLHIDAGKLLDGTKKNKIAISIMGKGTSVFADNFQDMFKVDSVVVWQKKREGNK